MSESPDVSHLTPVDISEPPLLKPHGLSDIRAIKSSCCRALQEYMRLQACIADQRSEPPNDSHESSLSARLKAQRQELLNDIDSLLHEVKKFQSVLKNGRVSTWIVGVGG